MTTATMPAGQLAAFDQAVSAYREACRAFAYREGTGADMLAAETALRQAGLDADTGLVTLPVTALHFTDVRADGARMRAVNGSLLGGEVWIAWGGHCLPYGSECQSYGPSDLVQVKGG